MRLWRVCSPKDCQPAGRRSVFIDMNLQSCEDLEIVLSVDCSLRSFGDFVIDGSNSNTDVLEEFPLTSIPNR